MSATSIGPRRIRWTGRDLACSCDLAGPCHADVLIRIAAGGQP